MPISINKLLKELGLSPNEITLFLTSTQIGPQPASVLADKVQFNRVTAYNTLKSLVKKGIMYEYIKNSLHFFAPENSIKLLRMAERKEEEWRSLRTHLEEAVQDIQTPYLKDVAPIMIKTYLGIEGIKDILKLSTYEEERILFSTLPQGEEEEYIPMWNLWFKHILPLPHTHLFLQNDRSTKHMLFSSALGLQLSHTFLDHLPIPNTDILLTPNFIALITYNKPIPQTIVLTSPSISSGMKSLLLGELQRIGIKEPLTA